MGVMDLFSNPEAKMERREKEVWNNNVDFSREQQSFNIQAMEDNTELLERQDRSMLIRWQQDPADILEEVRYKLLGYYREGNRWVKCSYTKPMVNIRFIHEIFDPFAITISSRIMANTKFEDGDARLTLKNYFNNLGKTLIIQGEYYGVDFLNYDNVMKPMKILAKSSVYQSRDGWGRRVNSTIFKSIESSHDKGAEQHGKKSIFSFNKSS